MNPLLSSRPTFIWMVANTLVALLLLTSCQSALTRSRAAALAMAPTTATPDLPATRAVATIEAALGAALDTGLAPSLAKSETPIGTWTPTPITTAIPDLVATQVALEEQITTAVAATLTAQPTPTPQPTWPPDPSGTSVPNATPSPLLLQGIGTVDVGTIVNLRSGPSTSFPVLMEVNPGVSVAILGRNWDASWLYVEAANGVLGWMSAPYVNTFQSLLSYPILVEQAEPALPWSPPTGLR